MGAVFAAEDPLLERPIALKVMLPHAATAADSRQRFLDEARAAAALQHDHVVAIYQVGEDRGVPFFAMPLLKGETLESRLKRDRLLPAAEAVRIGREIARGLAAAHEGGLIHRDIKPANIWLEQPAARVKILDFGLARPTRRSDNLTQSGTILGTPAYMSPEQAHGQPVDPRSDLFSLGSVLYHLCTGKPPFSGEDHLAILAGGCLGAAPAAPTKPTPTSHRRCRIQGDALAGQAARASTAFGPCRRGGVDGCW